MVAPESALRGFLDALGVPPQAIPADPAAQAGLYRSLVAGRRMLILLDNARDAAHVVDLLPGSSGSAVIVTSRDRLIGLVTNFGAQPVPLDVITTAEAERMLTTRLGTRLVAPAETMSAVVAACGGLPLALGIAAARATVLPRPSLTLVAAELRDANTRLSALDEEHQHSSLRSVMSWSCAALTVAQARVFALLGAAPGPDFGPGAASALTGLSPARTMSALRTLERQSLINQDAAGRWRMHDLVRLYAAEQAQHLIGHADRRSALRRLVTFYLHAAYAADRQLAPYRRPVRVDGSTLDAVPSFAGEPAAVEWLASEQPGLGAVQQAAMDAGWYVAAWQLAWAFDTYLRRRGQVREHVLIWQTGLAAAEQAGDPVALILVRRLLGHACARLGRHEEAREHMEAAMSGVRQSSDRYASAYLHRTYAQVSDLAGNAREALNHARASLHLFQALDDEPCVATQLNAVGWYSARLGLYEPARAHLNAALALVRKLGNSETEAGTLDSLGYLAHRTGDHALAVRYYQRGADLHHRNSDTYSEAETLEHLGDAQAAFSDWAAAAEAWQRALHLYRAQHRTSDTERVSRHLDR
jgi:tetratricopeptide (TPR) repeat protein